MLSEELRAQGWIEHGGALPEGRCDLLFRTGEIGERCNTALAAVAIGIEHIIAYKPEAPDDLHAD